MNLYLLVPNNRPYGHGYKEMVVAAESEESARKIHPLEKHANILKSWEKFGVWTCGIWASSPEGVSVKYLGTADPFLEKGIISLSYEGSR